MVLPEDNMTRFTNMFRERMPTTITLVFSAITKKTTHTSPRFKFTMFMRLKKNKKYTTEKSKRTIIWRGMIKTLKGSNITKNRITIRTASRQIRLGHKEERSIAQTESRM